MKEELMLEEIIFWILLIDSVSANAMTVWGREWYIHHLRTFSRYFPPARGWTLWYLILVLWIGHLVYFV